MSKKIIKGICLVATLLLFTMSMDAATANGVGKSEKKVWQDSDPNKENYFNNRRALVGPSCMINSLFDGVEVVSGTKDLQNISNDDLDDYATIPALVGATVVASPIISVTISIIMLVAQRLVLSFVQNQMQASLLSI